jgi:phosphate transport system permease protein
MTAIPAGIEIPRERRAWTARLFLATCLLATTLAVALLGVLLASIAVKGLPWIVDAGAFRASFAEGGNGLAGWRDWIRTEFFTEYASRRPLKAGIKAPLWGSVWVTGICALLALPVGVATAIYLEEFAGRTRLTRLIQTNIRNLAGVPSIVYGIIGLTAFARMFGVLGTGEEETIALGNPEGWFFLKLPFGQSVLAGGLTLMLVILPIVIISAQEAFRAVPASLRQASFAMGATTWQTVWNITLPAALPTILTGTILAISRAIGEAAPLLVLGVPLFISNTPANLMDDFTVLPFQIFDWARRPQADFQGLAAAAIVVLLVVLLSFNAVAVVIRQKLHRPLS